jgi:O-antigen ligase
MVLGNLGRIPVLFAEGKDAPILVNELLLVGVLGAAAVACLQARSLRLDAVTFAALAFAAIGAGSAFASALEYNLTGAQLVYSLAYLVRWLAYLGLYVAILNTARDEDADTLWATLERMVLVFVAFGVMQAIFLPGFAQRVAPGSGDAMGWDEQGHRLVSTLLDPNFAGALMLIPLLVQLGRMAFGVPVPAWKPLALLTGVLLTASRSSVLGLVVGGTVILAARGLSRRVVRFGALALIVALPFVPLLIRFGAEYNKFSVDGSALLRLVAWLRALTVLADHPVFGVGFNTYGFVQQAYGWEIIGRDGFGLDGGLLFVAVMTGLVGLAVYATMLGLVVRRCRRLWRDAGAPLVARGTALGAAASLAAVCVHSIFVNSLLLPFIMEPLAVLWGIVFLYARRRARVLAAERAEPAWA